MFDRLGEKIYKNLVGWRGGGGGGWVVIRPRFKIVCMYVARDFSRYPPRVMLFKR